MTGGPSTLAAYLDTIRDDPTEFRSVSRTVRPDGFAAKWTVPFIARGVPQEGDIGQLGRLAGGAMGVSFVELTNPYQSVGRSLKYAPMFMGLVFLAFFIFESRSLLNMPRLVSSRFM